MKTDTGVGLIATERKRQIEKVGWTPDHDANHREGELSLAAMCYAAPSAACIGQGTPSHWPWDSMWWKPSNHIRNLVKAGALIAAEIDRLQRKEQAGIDGAKGGTQ